MSGDAIRWRLAAAAVVLCGAAFGAHAQELTGTLKKIHDTKTVILGYRTASIPFSYVNKIGEPIGYSIDLCNAVVADIRDELEGVEPKTVYRKVTAETRIAAVRDGEVDLECGSTTANFARKKEVAFSPVFFVAGTKLLVARDSGVESYRDLRGKTVVVTAGTTNEAAVRAISDKQGLGIAIVIGKDHDESLTILLEGKADAFATDDVLLYGLVATHRLGARYHVVGDYLSYDPYGLMYRRDDPDFAAIVERTFTRLALSRELVQLYNRWFQHAPADRRDPRPADEPAARGNLPRRRRPRLIQPQGKRHSGCPKGAGPEPMNTVIRLYLASPCSWVPGSRAGPAPPNGGFGISSHGSYARDERCRQLCPPCP